MKKKHGKKCPKCETGILKERVNRPLGFKIFLFWLPFKRYQCNTCAKKTYVFGSYAHRKKAAWSKHATAK